MNPLFDFCSTAKQRIFIAGVHPLTRYLEQSAGFFGDLLKVRPELTLDVHYESDTETFNQAALCSAVRPNREVSFDILTARSALISGKRNSQGLTRDIADYLHSSSVDPMTIIGRVRVRQQNLRIPVNIVAVDDVILTVATTNAIPTFEDYRRVEPGSREYEAMNALIDTYLDPATSVYLSEPEDELIWVYDRFGVPRGIFPRSSFYTTTYGRYVVWLFVFNRKGQLLLQQRSLATTDNRGLWDKSVGGHVDLADASTSRTAKREMIEEMYMPDAEYTKYLEADVHDIVDFGEWSPTTRPERSFLESFEALGPADWIMFRATDDRGIPLTERYVSRRMISRDDGVFPQSTVFHVDYYFLIAPHGQLETNEQLHDALATQSAKAAARAHRLVELGELADWIRQEEDAGRAEHVFTDDLLHVNAVHRGTLERFAEFVKFVDRASLESAALGAS